MCKIGKRIRKIAERIKGKTEGEASRTNEQILTVQSLQRLKEIGFAFEYCEGTDYIEARHQNGVGKLSILEIKRSSAFILQKERASLGELIATFLNYIGEENKWKE